MQSRRYTRTAAMIASHGHIMRDNYPWRNVKNQMEDISDTLAATIR
jgi:hypothetical protein